MPVWTLASPVMARGAVTSCAQDDRSGSEAPIIRGVVLDEPDVRDLRGLEAYFGGGVPRERVRVEAQEVAEMRLPVGRVVLALQHGELVRDAVLFEAPVERLGILAPRVVGADVDPERQPLRRDAVRNQPVRAERAPAVPIAVEDLQLLGELVLGGAQRRGVRRRDAEDVGMEQGDA